MTDRYRKKPVESTTLNEAESHARICAKLAEEHKDDAVLFAALTDAAAIIRDLRSAVAAKQARIDALMLEYCPDEMTPEQVAEWARHQQPAAVDGGIDKARFERAPCYLCGYNGPGYYRPDTHPCAAKYHAALEELQVKK